MNRKNKFRIWDDKRKEWLHDTQHAVNLFGETIIMGCLLQRQDGSYVSLEDIYYLVAEQYIGLKDKNETEIYEGDIIKKTKYDKPFSKKRQFSDILMVVTWDSGRKDDPNKPNPSYYNEEPRFYGKRIRNNNKFRCCDWSDFHDCEIVGNIHDNPELMEE